MVFFESALILDVFHRHADALPRYRSYYGLAVALVGGRLGKGIELCRDACQESCYDAELFLNLGRLEKKAENLHEARRAFTRGYHLADHKAVFEDHLHRLDSHTPKVIPVRFGTRDDMDDPQQAAVVP